VVALPEGDRANPKKVEEKIRQHFLVLPNIRKFDITMMDRVYYDLLRIFANTMERENALLITFGFSFNDEHILDITRRALRNPTAQLIVFAHQQTQAADYQVKFDKQRNALVVAPPAGKALDMKELVRLLGAILPKLA
jgi:hypothetical protein